MRESICQAKEAIFGHKRIQPQAIGLLSFRGWLLRHRLARVLWILARLREICIRAFYARILIAMSELFFQPDVAVVVMLFNFDRAFRAIRITF
jgi:hypothetical protein